MISNLELRNMSKSELVTLLKRVWDLLWADEKTKGLEYLIRKEVLMRHWLIDGCEETKDENK